MKSGQTVGIQQPYEYGHFRMIPPILAMKYGDVASEAVI